MPRHNCLRLFLHLVWRACSLARASAGRSMAARMAMMAITTSNSIKVKALLGDGGFGRLFRMAFAGSMLKFKR